MVDGDVVPQLMAQRGDPLPLQATGDDVVEPGEVGAAVQRQPVRGDVVPTVHTCRGQEHPPVSTITRGALLGET